MKLFRFAVRVFGFAVSLIIDLAASYLLLGVFFFVLPGIKNLVLP